jgi:DNA topoisomerase-1
VTGLKELVSEQLGEIDAREINSIPLGGGMVVRVGRYGPYVQRGEERASIPEDLPPDELTVPRAEELLGAGSGDRVIGTDPATGLAVVVRAGRFGPYVQLGEPDEVGGRPRTASLLRGMDPEGVTLDEALRLLTLPRVVGLDPSDGEEIVAQNGRYGPYLKKGSDSRSLASEAELFTVTLDEALAMFAQAKTRRGRASAVPLRELGADPATGQPVVVREGRFGPYVSDGETNASLRKGDTVEGITLERAAELLADRRAAGPPAKRGRGARTASGSAASAKKAASGSAKKAAPAKKAASGSAKKAVSRARGGAPPASGSARASGPAGPVKGSAAAAAPPKRAAASARPAEQSAKGPAKESAKGPAKESAKGPAKESAKGTRRRA